MCQIDNYIKTPLTTGDEVNIRVGELSVVKCEVLRVEYNYHGEEGLHKVFVRSFNPAENCEYDSITGKQYFNIVLQKIDI